MSQPMAATGAAAPSEGLWIDRFTVISVLTLLLVLLHSDDAWYIRVPAAIFALAGFFVPNLIRNASFWLLLSLLSMLGNALNWQRADNHKYLIAYWCLAVGLSMLTRDPVENMGRSARLLIGAAFSFAVFWKLVSRDFLDGSFFETSLLFDDRFAYVGRVLGGMIQPVQASNVVAQRALLAYDSTLDVAALQYTAGIQILARFFTWWGLITETLVALAFLAPGGRLFRIPRDYFLLTFLFSTYAIASVIGFGWVLATMGYAQAREAPRSVARLYVLAVVVMQAYKLPWRLIFGYLTGSA
jgi:hypothetical protein